MKKIFLVIAVSVALFSFAQKSGTPLAAKTTFAKNYPGATKIKWEKEDGNYEASFELNGAEMSAIYNEKGALLESETEMKPAALPVPIVIYMRDHYKGIAVKGAAKITKADGSINYEAALKGKDIIFDAYGKFIKEAKD